MIIENLIVKTPQIYTISPSRKNSEMRLTVFQIKPQYADDRIDLNRQTAAEECAIEGPLAGMVPEANPDYGPSCRGDPHWKHFQRILSRASLAELEGGGDSINCFSMFL